MSKDVGGHTPGSKVGSSGAGAAGAVSKLRPVSARGGASDATREFKAVVYRDTGMKATFRRHWKSILLGTSVFFTLFILWGMQPLHGTVHIGICRTLIETQIKYPTSLKITAIEWFKNNLRIYFTHIDSFGQNRSEFFECEFKPDMTLADARINRKTLGADIVANFNKTIPQVIASKPDNTIPPGYKGDLLSLKRD